jgi:tight adherence protein B
LAALTIYDSAQGYVQGVLAKSRLLDATPSTKNSRKAIARIIFADLCRNGIPKLGIITRPVLRLPAVAKTLDVGVVYLASCGFVAQRAAVLQLAIAAFAMLAILGLVLFGELVVAFFLAACVLFLLWQKASSGLKKEKAANNEQLPDVIHTIGLCFSSGLSLQQAMTHTAQESTGQMSKLLANCASDMQAGRSVDEALANLEQHCEISDVRFMAVALEIQHLTGGALKDLLASAATAIRSDLELKRSLKVQTAQSQLSARIVSLLPLALVVLLSLAMDGYLATFFSSAEGFTLLVVAAILEVSGILLVRHILANGAGL